MGPGELSERKKQKTPEKTTNRQLRCKWVLVAYRKANDMFLHINHLCRVTIKRVS